MDDLVTEAQELISERIAAVLSLVDLLLLHDELLYDYPYSRTWLKLGHLDPIGPILRDCGLDPATRRELSARPLPLPVNRDTAGDRKATAIRDGSVYYVNLAALLGVPYWPSPARAEFLERNSIPLRDTGYVFALERALGEYLQAAHGELLRKLGVGERKARFLGFGAMVLDQCSSKDDFLQVALEIRQTKECRAFRAWLKRMDARLDEADLKELARGIQDLRGVLDDVSRGLGLVENDLWPKLSIGLSPRLDIPSSVVSAAWKKVAPRPLHVVFLRGHLGRVLSQGRLLRKATQIFGLGPWGESEALGRRGYF